MMARIKDILATRRAKDEQRRRDIAAALAAARTPSNGAGANVVRLVNVDELLTDVEWDDISDPVAKEVRFRTQLPAPITRETA